ncbi:unnamed protein product [Clavelina lepadiformis]|uniref:Uncharacterized protein n=1 Tax=Clavelina lepadiformis TaxID=159417 RepID=A0ABP0G2W4_CLALP
MVQASDKIHKIDKIPLMTGEKSVKLIPYEARLTDCFQDSTEIIMSINVARKQVDEEENSRGGIGASTFTKDGAME